MSERREPVAGSLNHVVSANVRRLRRERGWTQAELAKRLESTTFSPWSIYKLSDIENAAVPPRSNSKRSRRQRQITLDELAALAWALSVAFFDLLLPPAGDEVMLWNVFRGDRQAAAAFLFRMPPHLLSEAGVATLNEAADRVDRIVVSLFTLAARGEKDWRAELPDDVRKAATYWWGEAKGEENLDYVWDRVQEEAGKRSTDGVDS